MSTKQVGFRLEAEQVERLDRLADALSKRAAGIACNRTMAASAVIERGLVALEQELGLVPKKEAKPARKPAK